MPPGLLIPDGFTHIHKVLIANRGEIACRIIKTCRELGLKSIAIYSPADRSSLHVRLADEAYLLPGPDQGAYVDQDSILELATRTGAQAVIPGYGFLSENPAFAERVEEAGLTWVGPSSSVIRQFGLKHTARRLAVDAGVPVLTGSGLVETVEDALRAAEDVGYPIMLKATAGGGGMGLQTCYTSPQLSSAFHSVSSRISSLFSDAGMFVEKYITDSRHVEVQVFGDGKGEAVHFGERECSIQRRHQKVVEECPSPFVHGRPELRRRLTECAVSLAKSVSYGSAGTVEFLVDDATGEFFFLEMNTRLQVEHGITEMCYDVDLVSLMLQQAEMQARHHGGIEAASLLGLQKDAPRGFAIEARIYAEVPSRDYEPSPGLLQNVEWYEADHVRIDTWVHSGTNISSFYDPMIAKFMVWDEESHDAAVNRMTLALSRSLVQGCPTNVRFLIAIIDSEAFRRGETTTSFLSRGAFDYRPATLDVISGGAYTTIQDWPARRGITYGVPESGPMDSLSFRLANVIVGNPQTTEGIEVTLIGPELLFNAPAVVAVTGGVVDVYLDGESVDMYTRLIVRAGKRLKLGTVTSGCRSYVAIKGGFPSVPYYLGSKSTTSTLKMGGYQGRQLLANDLLELDPACREWATKHTSVSIPARIRLNRFWRDDWTLYVMPGPHDDPEFVTEADRDILYSTKWKISHNATRSGYRLKGPRLRWARTNGGEGGSHPANVIDEPYPYGGLNWNGDEPVLLPIDGPMAGGLATTTTVVRADLWRMGQCRPGNRIHFKRITWQSAQDLGARIEAFVDAVRQFSEGHLDESALSPLDLNLPEGWDETILHKIEGDEASGTTSVKFRQAGDSHIQVTYGPMTASALIRSHIQQVINRIHDIEIPGLVCVTGTTRGSVQFDGHKIGQIELLCTLINVESSLIRSHDPLPSRIFKFPILLEDPISKAAVVEYAKTVRSSAVYLPDNMDYIASSNGVRDRETASKSIVACPQLVTELSFLAGTPLFLPLDPRLVYVAQKYNPTRMFTPEGTVGLGGPLLVIYPMESPGGYQFWGRSLAAWDAYANKPGFIKPWLLREFDQIQFYEVDQAGFDRCYEDFKTGRFRFEVEETHFDPAAYKIFLDSIAEETQEFVSKRNAANMASGEEETKLLEEWHAKQAELAEDNHSGEDATGGASDGNRHVHVIAPMTSSVWKVLVEVGDRVKSGQTLAILEAMKMEIPIRADESMNNSTVLKVVAKLGSLMDPGQALLILAKDAD